MKKRYQSIAQLGRFFGRITIAVILCSIAASLCCLSFAVPAKLTGDASRTDWRGKVDPAVLTGASMGQTEFMIYVTPVADLRGAANLATKQEKGRYVVAQLQTAAEIAQPAVRQTLNSLGAEHRSFWISNVIWAKGDATVLEAVASLPQVASITAPGRGGLKLPPQNSNGPMPLSPDAVNGIEQSLTSVNADDVWALGYNGQGAVVAGADSGVRWTHTALKNHYRGWNGTTASHDYNWHDGIHNPNTGCPADSPEPCDDDMLLGGGHGSHTMGTMIGDDGGSNQIGMAPGAKWIACRNMNMGVGVPSTSYLECMQFFLAPTKIDGTGANPDMAPDVINNSWGCVEPGCVPEPNPPIPGFLRATLQASKAAGIVYVVSAGNDGEGGVGDCSTLEFPLARYPEAFSVGAIDHRTNVAADFSSRGPVLGDPDFPTGLPKPNITAPGVTIRSVQRADDNAYASLSGTSMSGPHVAGLVALMISANPKLAGNVDHIRQIIEQTAVPMTTTQACGTDTATSVPNNVFGWGRINALAAVTQALAEATPVSLVKVVSRKTHGDAGNFDVDLPLNGSGVECRSGQAGSRQHTLVFTFAKALTNVSSASVESGAGSVSSSGVGADAHEYIVNLTGVPNAENVQVKLRAITDAEGDSTPALTVGLGFLNGDTNGDRTVNSADIGQTKAQSGASLTNSNFREDLNADGFINSADVSLAKSRSGTALPTQQSGRPGRSE